MNRIIKFRAWDDCQKEMYHPIETLKNYWSKDDGCFLVQVIETENGSRAMDWGDEIIMQYTGMKDKNGVEIYEGDILSDGKDSGNPIGVVYFYAPQFVVQTLDDVPHALAEGKVNMKQLDYTEVIGNIYQNKELLEPLTTNQP